MEQEKNEIAVNPQQAEVVSAFTSPAMFDHLQRVARMYAQSAIVPAQFQMKNPNDVQALANCVIALDMSIRMKANPLMIMQNLYNVHGNPGWSSKFLIACLNGCGKFSPLRYKYDGEPNTDEWSCRAYAIDKATGEELSGAAVSIGMAKKEGWYSKAGSKWQTMPELMLQYRSAAFFQRAYAPEISMGLNTVEENEDIVRKPEVEDTTAIVVDEEQKQAAAKLF